MIYLNAGNLWDDDYLNTVIKWNEEFKTTIQVKSLFGSVAGLTPTARSVDRLPYRDWAFTDRYVLKAQEHGIAIRYTLNQSCIGAIQDFGEDWRKKLYDDICELHDIGIHEWTIASPLLVELLRSMYPDDFIEVSTIAEVATPQDVERWLMLGVNGVNISTSVNRDIPMISWMGIRLPSVSILANEACLFGCPWRRECYNLSSHNSERSEELFGFYPFSRCNKKRLADPVEWIRSRMVLPQWMNRYQDLAGVDWFKIAYRTHPKEIALPILRAYMEQQFTGNLCDLWPTISNLGGTVDPKEITCISCERMDKIGVLDYFIEHGNECSDKICGHTCFVCNNFLEGTLCQG